ncbi:MAG: sigma-70 family RNA polymerase sigma factor [Planctomycetota bacterium]
MNDETHRSVWDLGDISTQWSQLGDTNVFVLRYVRAIENYLNRLIGNEDEANEVLQTFLVRVLEKGFEHADPDRGRFRHYLSRSVRNAARTYQRGKSRSTKLEAIPESGLAESDPLDSVWQKEWHDCILNRALQKLRHREQTSSGNLGHTIIQLHIHDEANDSAMQAQTLSSQIGREISPAAYRKQLSRARHALAEFLVQEVAETVDSGLQEDIRNELRDVGLWQFVEDFVD